MSANDQATPSADVPRKPRRRWLRFSLRTLLILVTLLSIGLGWFVHRGERQRRSVAALEEMRAGVFYDPPHSWPAKAYFYLSRWLPRDYFDDVHSVHLGIKATDAAMVHLKGLNRLQEVDLSGTQVTDVGLAHIQELRELRSLDLTGTQVTDVGLAHVQGLSRLESLQLIDTQVTNAGLAHLQDMTELTGLGLAGTQVTDAGMANIQGLTRLELLILGGTQVTDARIAKLQSALPKCWILH